MAIGDYSKTTYVNGVAPAINAANLNNNENKVKELDTVVSENTSDISTLETTVSGLGAREIPVSTTSRILDLTGDRAPAIPDDPAGVTYLSNFATTDGWVGSNASVSVSGEKLIATCGGLGPDFGMDKNIAATGNIIIIKARASKSGTLSTLIDFGHTSEVSLEAGVWKTVGRFYSGTTSVFSVRKSLDVSIGDTLEIDWVYIGTGAYLSKLVDRAGVPWTNYGALPVDGPFGKCLQFNGAQYLQAPGPMIGTTGTVAISFAVGSLSPSNTKILFDNRNASARSGIVIGQISANVIFVGFADSSAIQQINIVTVPNILQHDISISYTPTSVKVYFDGVLVSTTTITVGSFLSVSSLKVGIDSALVATSKFFGTIYALRADSRVWTDDEIARWSRDPYSEDSGLVDAFSLSFANLPTFADNAAAIAGNLPAGKLYKTSTGNVLVRY